MVGKVLVLQISTLHFYVATQGAFGSRGSNLCPPATLRPQAGGRKCKGGGLSFNTFVFSTSPPPPLHLLLGMGSPNSLPPPNMKFRSLDTV